MKDLDFSLIRVESVFENSCREMNISVSVLRLDLIHPIISGNKWFKLRFYFDEVKQLGRKRIITFGGPFSNHIAATAGFCSLNNLHSVGIIRGEYPRRGSKTMDAAKEQGMDLLYLSRADYQEKKIPFAIDRTIDYIIPEGGYGVKGAAGFATALDYCNKNEYTHFVCAVGTGTMMAGLIKDSRMDQQIIGISVLKSNTNIIQEIKNLLTEPDKQKNFSLFSEYSFGGYAKHKPELFDFMNQFYDQTGIESDFVYTAKLLYGVENLIQKKYFPAGSKVLVIHSGGLQGNSSLKKSKVKFLSFT